MNLGGIIKGLILGLLLISLSFAALHEGTQTDRTAIAMVKVTETSPDGEEIVKFDVFVLVGKETDLRASPDYQDQNQQRIRDLIEANRIGQYSDTEKDLLLGARDSLIDSYSQNPQVESVRDAEVTVYFYDNVNDQFQPVEKCEGIIADKTKPLLDGENVILDDQGNPLVFYYAECTIPKDLYAGTCTSFNALYLGDASGKNRVSSVSTEVCDKQLQAIPAFNTQLRQVLSSPSNSAACFAAFIMFGLLLATMYFSGKSPLSLLDITTPRLPSPKSLMPSGQILGPYGSTELRRAMDRMMKSDQKLFNLEGKKYSALISGASLATINRWVNSIKAPKKQYEKDLQDNKDFFKGLAILAAKHGISLNDLKPLATHTYAYDDKKQQALGKILADIEKGLSTRPNERDYLYLLALKRWAQTTRTIQSWDVFTGHRKVGERVAFQQKVKGVIKDTLGQYYLLQPLVAGSWDSLMRSVWQFERFGKAVKKEVSRRAVEIKARKGKAAGAVPAGPTPPKDDKTGMILGKMEPTLDRMGTFYTSFNSELHNDMARYVISQLLARHAIDLRMSEHEMFEMGHKDMDVVAKAGLRKAMHDPAFRAMEAEIRKIMADASLVESQKVQALLDLAQRQGAHIDHKVSAALNELKRIDGIGPTDKEGHIKLLSLYEYLQDKHGFNNPAHSLDNVPAGEFHFLVGRDRMPKDQNWSQMVLRNWIYNLEKGFASFSMQHALEDSHMNMVNRLVTLRPTQHDETIREGKFPKEGISIFPDNITRNAQYAAIERRMADYIRHSLTAEGEKAFREKTGKDAKTATLQELIEHTLYGYKWMEKTYDIKGGSYGSPMLAGREGGKGAAHWWESPHEFGADKSWHVGDKKRHWVDKPGQDFALYEYAEKRFGKSYLPYYKATIEAELDRQKLTDPAARSAMAKQLFIKDLLFHDIQDMGNSIWSQNAYGTTNNHVRSLIQDAVGFLRAALKEHGKLDPRLERQLADDIKDLNRGAKGPEIVNRIAKLLSTHDNEFREYVARSVRYDTIAKSDSAWVMKYAGGFVPWHEGMEVNDRDRVYGYVAMRDHKGQYRRWDPDMQKIDFGLNMNLKHAYGELMQGRKATGERIDNKNPEKWKDFLDAAKAWAGDGTTADSYSRLKTFNGVLWQYSQYTEDWKGMWSRTNLTIKPKHEVAPLPPTIWRFITEREYTPWTEKQATKIRNIGLEVGHSISRIWQDTASELTKALYGSTMYTEVLRQTSWRMAEHVKRADWDSLLTGLGKNEREELKKVYQAAADSHAEYHQIWDYTIDRHPARTSTSFASRHRWGGYFQYGPYEQYELKATWGAAQSRSEYLTTTALTWPVNLTRRLGTWVTSVFRPVQESFMGAIGKWDTRESTLKRWEHTPPRMLEAFRTFVNPIAAMTGKDILFKSSTVQHDLSGERLAKGLKIAPQDINWVMTGTYAEARTGAANPGASYYTYRYSLVPAEPAAQFMTHRSHHAAFFVEDPYLKKYALVSTTKREVDSIAFQLERERELRGFGVTTNPIWGWAGMLPFYYHGAGGIMPWWMTPRELITQGVQKARRGQLNMNAAEMAKETMEKFMHGAQTFASQAAYPGSGMVFCTFCSKPGYRAGSGRAGAGTCSKCHAYLV